MDLLKEEEGKFNIMQIAMTMATLAYDSTEDLISELKNKKLATEGDWSLVWGPVDKESNRVFIARKKDADEYVIAIRGTVRNIESIFMDVDLDLVSLPWNKKSKKMLSDGMSDAWNHFNNMTDPKASNMSDFLKTLASNSKVYITGHSQGGCLATVVSLWLAQTFSSFSIIPITFAAETAGNKTFSDLFNNTFGNLNYRVFNPNDVVPMCFGDLNKIKKLYGNEPPYVKCPEEIKIALGILKAVISTYVQIGTEYPLPNKFLVKVKRGVNMFNRPKFFIKEVEIQHSCFTYLYLLDAPQTKGAPATWPPTYIK